MAGLPWIKVAVIAPNHPKVQRLEKLLGISDALGVMVRLWCWTATYYPEGEFPKDTADAMASAAAGPLVTLTRNAVTQALVTCGVVEPLGERYRVHDWDEFQAAHADKAQRDKDQNRERQRRFRNRRRNGASRVTDNVTSRVTGNGVTAEKEREKEKETERETDTQKHKAAAKESESLVLTPLPPKPVSPLVSFLRQTFPDISDPWACEEAWAKAFPAVDLLAEALKAQAWETADPKRKKTNHGRFLNSWFARSQDGASQRRDPPRTVTAPALPSTAFTGGRRAL